MITTLLAGFVLGSMATLATVRAMGYVSGRRHTDCLNTLKWYRDQLDVEFKRADGLAKKVEEHSRITQEAINRVRLFEGMTEAADNRWKAAMDKIDAMRIGGEAKCPQCARLRERIRRFFEQKKIIKQAYVDDVMLKSHGQVDKRALIEAERYLLVDDDNELRTFGEIRDAEIERALKLLEQKNVESKVNQLQEKTA